MECFWVDDEVWALHSPLKDEWLSKYPLLIFYSILDVCRFIYTGNVDVSVDIAQDLLRAADQYLLEGLKRLCEYSIAQVG